MYYFYYYFDMNLNVCGKRSLQFSVRTVAMRKVAREITFRELYMYIQNIQYNRVRAHESESGERFNETYV